MENVSRKEQTSIIVSIILLHLFLLWLLSLYVLPALDMHHIPAPVVFDFPEASMLQDEPAIQPEDIEWASHAGALGQIPEEIREEQELPNLDQQSEISSSEIQDHTSADASTSSTIPESFQDTGQEDLTTSLLDTYAPTQPTEPEPSKEYLPTFADITHRVAQLAREQQAIASIATTSLRDNRAVSGKQMVLERYELRVMQALRTAFSQHRTEFRQYPFRAPCGLKMVLRRNGSIHLLQLAQSTGTPNTDQFILTTTQEASKHFPALPDCIKQDFYDFPCISFVALEAFLEPITSWTRTAS